MWIYDTVSVHVLLASIAGRQNWAPSTIEAVCRTSSWCTGMLCAAGLHALLLQTWWVSHNTLCTVCQVLHISLVSCHQCTTWLEPCTVCAISVPSCAITTCLLQFHTPAQIAAFVAPCCSLPLSCPSGLLSLAPHCIHTCSMCTQVARPMAILHLPHPHHLRGTATSATARHVTLQVVSDVVHLQIDPARIGRCWSTTPPLATS